MHGSQRQATWPRHKVTDSDDRYRTKRPDDATIERAQVRIDSKGRLSVDVVELAASRTFRAELGEMVELARTHPPKTGSS